jgi:predicted ATP-binding protein involved in virulence
VPFNQTTNHQYSYQEITVNKHRDLACCNAYLEAINGVIEKNLKESGWNHIGYDVIRKEIYATNNNDVAVPVKNLSAGTKAVLGIVADLAYRCCQLNPQCGNAAPESTPGIVLIDEIELHLHPAWQQRIILDLQRAFPQIQLIITTHSPQVISSVPKECIRVIADGQVIQPEIETEGARAEQVLNEVFGTDSRVDELPIVKDLNKYKKLIEEDKWDSQEALELKRRLYENLSSDPELSRMAIDVKVKEYKRGHGQK